MLISRTPLRVSFVGGGSDVVSFSAEHGGAVVSTAIDKYVYVAVNKRFEETTRVSYSRTEIVASIDELEHELAREALRTRGDPARDARSSQSRTFPRREPASAPPARSPSAC